jgi:preprotein translocase subunit SecD
MPCPPSIVNWLFRCFGGTRNNDAILGDLDERLRAGRSCGWYCRQVLLTIISQRLRQARRISGGYMRRTIAVVGAVFVALFIVLIQAQAQFTIHAASDQPVAGWDRMQAADHAVWVSPTVGLTSADILRAEPTTDSNGHGAVGIILTDTGANKMRGLSKAQMNKLIAMVLDGRVIFAPKVRAEIGKEAKITGPASSGLPAEVVQRIVESVNRK